MDVRQLRYFLTVAREGQVTSAARLLNMEQPPLSRQMRQLEQELHATLFDRSGKRFTLTHAGQLLRTKAEQLLQQFEETVQEVRELEEGIQGVLSIGSVVSCISLLPPQLERFRSFHPGVSFKIREGDHFLLGELLEKRSIELIVARLPFEAASAGEQCDVLPLTPDPFVAVLPERWSPASSEQTLTMEQLAQYPFLSLKSDQTTGMHERVLQRFHAAGLEPDVLCECSSVAIILALVAAGIGATILPKSVMAAFSLPNITLHDLDTQDFQSEVGLVWLKDRYLSKTARRFIEQFKETITPQRDGS